jgi:hypothetical protein
MTRPSIGARLAGALSVAVLVGATFAQAAPILAASPGPGASRGHGGSLVAGFRPVATHFGSRGKTNIAALMGKAPKALPFDPAVAGAVLGRLEARPRLIDSGAGVTTGPALVGPPPPDLATTSGEVAASTPIAVAGQTESAAGGQEPADPGIAVGPDGYIQTNNLNFVFGDRGVTAGLLSIDMPTFFNLPETFGFTTWDYSPRVHFDTLRQRWIASEVSWDCATYALGTTSPSFGHGFVDFGISDTRDALGPWSFAYFETDDALPDQPSFGTSTDKLGFTDGSFQMGPGGSDSTPGCVSGAFLGSELRMMDWAELVPNFNPTNVHSSNNLQANMVSLRAVIQEPVSSPALRLVGSVDMTTTSDVYTAALTGSVALSTIGGGQFDLTTDNILPKFMNPPSPHQPGGLLTSIINGQPDSAIYRDGTVAFSSTYPCTPAGDVSVHDCIRVVTLSNLDPTLEPIRLGDTLLATTGADLSFGGIAWSGSGLLHAVYTRSSTSSDASSYERYSLPVQPILWSAPQLLTQGQSVYTGTRWGDFNGIASDPQDPNAVWSADPATDGSGQWLTTIHQIVVGSGAGYVAIAPVRVLNSRDGIGLTGFFLSNVPRTISIAGKNGIPEAAVAITANLTVTAQDAAGYISLTPTPTVNPSSSTLNFPLGDNRANNTTIALAADGSLSAVYKAVAGHHAHVILDVTGYFLTGGGEGYFPLTPVRILDSRPGHHIGVLTSFQANVSMTIPVRSVFTIPSDATAITANLTVTGQTKPGYVSVTLDPDNAPTTSTINFPLGDNRANGLSIPIEMDGTVSAVYKAASGKADLIMDVTGYYSFSSGGLLFHPLNPGRRVDTRQPLGALGYYNGLTGAQGTAPRQVSVGDHFGVPVGALAITGNITVTGQTGPGFVTLTDVSVPAPTTSTINFPLGDTRANGITTPLGPGPLPLGEGVLWMVYQPLAGRTVQLILDITGYFQ